MTRCVVFLQNAWSWDARPGEAWLRDSWLRALWESPTGKALARIFPNVEDVWIDNTTPEVADSPEKVLPPNWGYMAHVIKEQQPRFLVACGKQAERVLVKKYRGRLVVMPHPTWRLMSNTLLDHIREVIAAERFSRVKITTEGRNQIVTERVP